MLEEEDGGQDTGQVDQVCKSSKVAGPLACYDYRQLPNSGGFEVRILPTAWDRGTALAVRRELVLASPKGLLDTSTALKCELIAGAPP